MDEKVSTFPTVNGRQYGDDDAESFGSVRVDDNINDDQPRTESMLLRLCIRE